MDDSALTQVLADYRDAFEKKEFAEADSDSDPLMEAFGITPTLKAANRQYWGRELGMCWQRLCVALCAQRCGNRFAPPPKVGGDEPYDLRVDDLAIDTKYRIGSGDSGTLKKFKANGAELTKEGLTPTMLILRTDNLRAAIGACEVGGWDVQQGDAAFALVRELTGFDLRSWLVERKGQFPILPPDD